jgi:threonine synthase
MTGTKNEPQSHLAGLRCSKCGSEFNADKLQTVCSKCQGVLLAQYSLERVKNEIAREVFSVRLRNMWRYRELMPVKDSKNIVTLGEGCTPILQLDRLGRELGLSTLLLKDDGMIPTGTFKARGLSAAVSKAKELGVRRIAIPTAGNAGAAIAAYGAKAGIETFVFMPKDAPHANKAECLAYGAKVYLVDGLINDAGRIVAKGKESMGWFDVSTTKEPYRVEGKKTMGLEIAEELEWTLPDVILYPTGGGTGIIGMWKAFNELEQMGWIKGQKPRMFSIQSEGCAPLVKSFREGKDTCEPWPNAKTEAAGLRVPKPYADYLILKILRESHGGAVAVSENSIFESQRRLASKEGIFAAPEGAATVQGLTELLASGEIEKSDTVLLYNTGTGILYTDLIKADLKVLKPDVDPSSLL